MATVEGKFVELNPAWETTLGWTLDELRAKPFYDFIHPSDRMATDNVVARVASGQRVVQFKNRYIHKDGGWRVLSWRGHMDNDLGLIFGVGRDITAVEEASKLASLGEMAGGIAHEINNPLAIIYGKANQVRERIESGNASPESITEGIKKIEDTAMRIAKIVRGLSTLSRHTETDPFEKTDLAEIVEETVLLCEERFKNRDITCRVTSLCKAKVFCRPAQISQVLLNLLNNASDAIEGLEHRWIEVAVDELDERVRLIVRDSGAGIPPALIPRLMDPFFTTKDPGKGTGLGLSIAKAIMEDHQGNISYNQSSSNTEFVAEIPKERISSNLKQEPRSQDLHLH